jgi:hypothetical protein
MRRSSGRRGWAAATTNNDHADARARASLPPGALPRLWLRPPRHAGAVPRVRYNATVKRTPESRSTPRRHARWKRAVAVGLNLGLASLSVFWLCLWIASYWYCHNLYVGNDRGTSGYGLNLRSTPGSLECTGITFESEPGRTAAGFNAYLDAQAWAPNRIRRREWVRAGFGVQRWQQPPLTNAPGPKYTNSYFGIALPFWLLALVCGIAPALRWNPRRLRRRRLAAGLCPSCGYDLRATPERCPECGAAARIASAKLDS